MVPGVVAASWEAALLAAGAGPDAIERLEGGEAREAFLAVRPPGHHATPTRAMGFCLLNNVAVTAAVLAARGEKVLILDWDAHHGNGTQDAFYADPRVLYVSFHEYPLYPGTGRLQETGSGAGQQGSGSAGGGVVSPSTAGSSTQQQAPGAAGAPGRAGGIDPSLAAAALGSLGALGLGSGFVLRRRRS